MGIVPLATLLLLVSFSFSAPTSDHKDGKPGFSLPLPARTVAQLDAVPTWLENIAVRPNGDLLVTQLAPLPVLLTVKSPTSTHATLEPIYQ
jgi:hypothetical protein